MHQLAIAHRFNGRNREPANRPAGRHSLRQGLRPLLASLVPAMSRLGPDFSFETAAELFGWLSRGDPSVFQTIPS